MVDGRWGYYCISQYHSKEKRGKRYEGAGGREQMGEILTPETYLFFYSRSWLHKLFMIEIGNIYIMLNTVCT